MMVFFTADSHFNHKRICELAQRPFSSVEEMNKHLIKVWNSQVAKKDVVYHLGDLAFGRDTSYLRFLKATLNGEIRLIIGNHDLDNRKGYEEVFGSTWMPRDMFRVRHESERIVVCHYALRTWHGQHYGSWHLHGHSHGSLPPFGKSVDVGVDAPFLKEDKDEWGMLYPFPKVKAFMDSRHVAVPDAHQVASRR